MITVLLIVALLPPAAMRPPSLEEPTARPSHERPAALPGQETPVVPPSGEVRRDTTDLERADGDPTRTADFEALLESVVESSLDVGVDMDREAEVAMETVTEARLQSLPINSASRDQLRGLPGLTALDIERILTYRRAGHVFETGVDLYAAGLSDASVALVLPSVSFKTAPAQDRSRVGIDLMQRWKRRHERTSAADPGRATVPLGAGTPVSARTRIGLRIGSRVSAGVTLDHDAGEPVVWNPLERRFGADYAAGYVSLARFGPLERLIVGAFDVRFGEGLVLGQGLGTMSGIRLGSVDRMLKPHTSSREYGYFNGGAVQTRAYRGVFIVGFLASQRMDGRLDSLTGAWRLVSPGPHRTSTEVSGRGLIPSRTAGGVVTVRRGPVHLAVAALTTEYGLTKPRTSSNIGIAAGWVRPRAAATLEATSDGHRLAGTAVYEPSQDAAFSMRFMRSDGGNFYLHSTLAVDSRGEATASRELEAEVRVRPLLRWKGTGRLRWRSRGSNNASMLESRRFEIRVHYLPRTWLDVQLRGVTTSAEHVAVCLSGLQALRCATWEGRQSLRLDIGYLHSRMLESRTRLELIRIPRDDRSAHGVLLFQDVRWHASSRLQVDVRYAVHASSDAASRPYMLERDVLYAFTAPSLGGRGRRWYVLLRYDGLANTTIQIKCAVSAALKASHAASTLGSVAENGHLDLTMQIRWHIG